MPESIITLKKCTNCDSRAHTQWGKNIFLCVKCATQIAPLVADAAIVSGADPKACIDSFTSEFWRAYALAAYRRSGR